MNNKTPVVGTAREQVFMDYACDAGNRITNPGKFEGEPIFAPYLWDRALEGLSDYDDGKTFYFRFNKADLDLSIWPELKQWLGRKRTLKLREDDNGFVHCS